MHGQDGIGTGWKNYVKRLKENENATDCALGFLIFSNALFLESKIEEKNVKAKVDKVEARTRTGEVFTY